MASRPLWTWWGGITRGLSRPAHILRTPHLPRALSRAWPIAVGHAPFLVVLLLGAVLRLYLLVIYRPVAGGFNDSITYLLTSHDRIFSDANRMAGYPFFLRVLRYIQGELSFVIVVQHLLGMLTAVLLYAAVRRVIGGRWLPVLPAAFFLFSGDYLLLEHSLLTETLYMLLVTLGVTAAIYAVTLGPRHATRTRHALYAGSALSLGTAWTVRTVAMPIIVFVAVWVFAVGGSRLRARLRSTGAFAGPAAAVVVAYIVLQGAMTGFWGVLPGAGWIMYMRAAPFADCREFDPPQGTQFLCESTPSRARPGPSYYQFVDGPAIRHFGDPFNNHARGSDMLGEFARAAILGQPLDYLREVSRDSVRYIVPTAGLDRAYGGPGPDELDIGRRSPEIETATVDTAEAVGFDASPVEVGSGIHLLGDLQNFLRVGGLSLVAMLALGLCGVAAGTARVRQCAALLFGVAVLQGLVPAATISWGYRYGAIGMALLVGAAALGVFALAKRHGPSGGRLASAGHGP